MSGIEHALVQGRRLDRYIRTPQRLRSAVSFVFWLFLVVAPVTGCKEAADLGNLVGSVSGTSRVSADFQPATIPPTVTDHYVSLRKSSASRDMITIDVVINAVSEPVSGIAIKLEYDASMARFANCSDGTLLPAGTCYAAEQPAGSGIVFIGRSITAPQPAVSGSGTVVRLIFQVTREGQSTIRFDAQNLGGGDATALIDENGDPILVTWFEGDLLGT
jgi:hypothetical protein